MSAAMSFAGPQVYSYAAARPLVYVDPDGRNLSPMQDCSTIGPVTICSPTSGVLGGEAAPFGTGLARSSAAALARRIGGTAWLGGKFLCWLTDCESIPPPGEKPPPDDDGMCVEDSGGGRPGNNIEQRRQFDAAVRECERQIGRQLSAWERDRLHQALHELGDPGYWDIVEECVGMFG
ncbi:MAG: hypothetical protein IT383_07570 [Deltaproteobacteria bacterium]|nr:hypothetical protein [Deltaproteobacteria bacterium]